MGALRSNIHSLREHQGLLASRRAIAAASFLSFFLSFFFCLFRAIKGKDFYWAAVPGAPVDQDRSERRALHTGPPVEAWQCVEFAASIHRS